MARGGRQGELWILFIDLKCFFPSMPRHILRLVL